SVAVRRGHALVGVDTSPDFANPSGHLDVVDIATRTIVRTIPLGGQPDSIALSPDGNFAAIAIENQRDEELGDGAPPQLPAGFLVIVDLVGGPATWTTRTVDLTGIADLFPEDPEPEFVDVNAANLCVVTLQENNHVALVDLPTGQVVFDFPCGTVDLAEVDTNENDLIQQDSALQDVPREPDAVAWTSLYTLATADEGDLFGGSRGFTTWNLFGQVLHEAGSTVEHLVARVGHYPESRSENKGSEPESVEFGSYADGDYLFVGSERANVVLVYRLSSSPLTGAEAPQFVQVLPTGIGPEGLLAIPSRDLLVVACEEDSREDKYRASIQVYVRGGGPTYPTLVSRDRRGTSVPIPWAAQSGLAADPLDAEQAYSVHDSYYRESRIYTLDLSATPTAIVAEKPLRDTNGVLLAALEGLQAQLPGTDDFDPADIVNADGTVNLDLEGIAVAADGSFWLASEGAGNLAGGVSDPEDQPFAAPNLLLHAAADGTLLDAVPPPLAVTQDQFRFGYEGVAVVGDLVYVCFQRRWAGLGDPANHVRLGRYDTATGAWAYAYYGLDAPASPNGGSVGLSELAYAGDGEFVVIERDDQGGPDAAVKRLYRLSIDGVTFADHAATPAFDTVAKTLVLDLLAAGTYAPYGGLVPEKQEGLTVLADGDLLLVNDNDGVEDNNGETLLLRLENLLD
ncbi:MAG TPA: esterase-like activity of phytase family protein, partial [Planctomycetota bacterium]|nr:esterase-like activity of phytase family protein [Planctomycetota bacterium]